MLKLTMFGCNYRTADIAVRERFAFSPEQCKKTLQKWSDAQTHEAVLLATCNRTELYVASENGTVIDDGAICQFLCDEKNVMPETVRESLIMLHDDEAVSHLFRVAGSLDSMVLGEPQILSQVKAAYQTANEIGTAGSVLHGLFQASLKVAKRIVGETEIHQRRTSIPSVAVADFAMQIFERLDDKKTLVLGAGEMADETLRYLTDQGAMSILVINRSTDHAQKLAEQWHGHTDTWENRFARLAEVDVVISTTGATEPIVRLDDYLAIESRRQGRPLFVLDLAMPRDFDPAIGSRENVFLYSVDDLKETCERNQQSRNRELPKAEKIIKQECGKFWHDMRSRETGSIIRRLREDWESRKETELTRLFHKLPNLSETEQREVRYAFDRLINKLLHPPLESLRDEAYQPHHGVTYLLQDAISRLFRLKD
ncbi:MAG: glutamyl-tRNA reductase [Planctomycetaceae bacterium]|jgi:glutamyl-tRNA reductase|nr:glutamyl-tRNA reductase [Planctomycetaceae bacterium]